MTKIIDLPQAVGKNIIEAHVAENKIRDAFDWTLDALQARKWLLEQIENRKIRAYEYIDDEQTGHEAFEGDVWLWYGDGSKPLDLDDLNKALGKTAVKTNAGGRPPLPKWEAFVLEATKVFCENPSVPTDDDGLELCKLTLNALAERSEDEFDIKGARKRARAVLKRMTAED